MIGMDAKHFIEWERQPDWKLHMSFPDYEEFEPLFKKLYSDMKAIAGKTTTAPVPEQPIESGIVDEANLIDEWKASSLTGSKGSKVDQWKGTKGTLLVKKETAGLPTLEEKDGVKTLVFNNSVLGTKEVFKAEDPITVYAVVKANSSAGYQTVVALDQGENDRSFHLSIAKDKAQTVGFDKNGMTGFDVFSNNKAPINKWGVVIGTRSQECIQAFVDNTGEGSVNFKPTNNRESALFVGARGAGNQALDGEVVLVRVYKAIHDEKTRTAVMKQLSVPKDSEVAVPKPDPTPAPSNGYKGQLFVNLGMGQGGSSAIPGVLGTNFAFAIESEVKRALSYGFKRFRIGFLWERVVKDLNTMELYRGKDSKGKNYSLDEMIKLGRLCKGYGATIKWDMHNYGQYKGKVVGTAGGPTIDQFAKTWKAIMEVLKSDKDCWAATYGFDTMNEWIDGPFTTVFAANQKVIDLCAPISEDKMFVLEGIKYSSTANWVTNNNDYYKISHPRGKAFVEFSGHLYLDHDASGYYKKGEELHPEEAKRGVTALTVGTTRLKGFADWLEKHGFKGNIGENFVHGNLPNLLKGERALLQECQRRGIDVYLFGMGDWFDTGKHNIELPMNKGMLDLAREITGK